MRTLLILFSILVLSCSSESNDLEIANKKTEFASDTSRLATMYFQAIQDYIRIMKEQDKKYDTLYLLDRKWGTPDDFPNIALPEEIDNVAIKLLDSAKANSNFKTHYSEKCPAINLIGWVDSIKAEFIFVTFYPGFAHKYDLRLYYAAAKPGEPFKLISQKIEYF